MDMSKELTRLLSSDGSELSIVAYGQTGTGKTFTTTYIEGEREPCPPLGSAQHCDLGFTIFLLHLGKSVLRTRSLNTSLLVTTLRSRLASLKSVGRLHTTFYLSQPYNQ